MSFRIPHKQQTISNPIRQEYSTQKSYFKHILLQKKRIGRAKIP